MHSGLSIYLGFAVEGMSSPSDPETDDKGTIKRSLGDRVNLISIRTRAGNDWLSRD